MSRILRRSELQNGGLESRRWLRTNLGLDLPQHSAWGVSLGYEVGQVLSAFVTRVGGVTSPRRVPRDRYLVTQRRDTGDN